MIMEHLWVDNEWGKPKYLEKSLHRRHLVYHKSKMEWPGIEPGSSWWKAGD